MCEQRSGSGRQQMKCFEPLDAPSAKIQFDLASRPNSATTQVDVLPCSKAAPLCSRNVLLQAVGVKISKHVAATSPFLFLGISAADIALPPVLSTRCPSMFKRVHADDFVSTRSSACSHSAIEHT